MLKGLSDEGNSLVIIRENVQSNLREREACGRWEIFLVMKKGLSPSSLIISIPTLLAPRRVGVIAGRSRTCLKGCCVIVQ